MPPWVALLGLVALAALLRLPWIGAQSLWLDEVTSYQQATKTMWEIATSRGFNAHTPPFYYLLLHVWVALAGASEAALRLPSALVGVATVPLLYALARPIGHRVALGAAAIGACSPFLVYYGQEARMYALLCALTLTAWLCAERGGRLGWGGYALAAATSLYTHYYAAPFLAALNLVLLPRIRRQGEWLPWLAANVFAVAAFLPWVPVVMGLATGDQQGFRRFLWTVLPYAAFRFNAGYGVFPMTPEARDAPVRAALEHLPSLVVYGIVASLPVLAAIRSLGGASPLLRRAAGILAAVTVLVVAMALVNNSLSERYLIVVFPAFAILQAAGLESASPRWRRILWAGFAALALVANGLQQLSPRAARADWRGAAAAIRGAARDGDRVACHADYACDPIDYYGAGLPAARIRLAEAMQCDAAAPEGGRGRLFLVIGHADAAAPSQLDACLSGRGLRQVDEWWFPQENGIRVILYEPHAPSGREESAPRS